MGNFLSNLANKDTWTFAGIYAAIILVAASFLVNKYDQGYKANNFALYSILFITTLLLSFIIVSYEFKKKCKDEGQVEGNFFDIIISERMWPAVLNLSILSVIIAALVNKFFVNDYGKYHKMWKVLFITVVALFTYVIVVSGWRTNERFSCELKPIDDTTGDNGGDNDGSGDAQGTVGDMEIDDYFNDNIMPRIQSTEFL